MGPQHGLELLWQKELSFIVQVASHVTKEKRPAARRWFYRREAQQRTQTWLSRSGINFVPLVSDDESVRLSTPMTVGVNCRSLYDLLAIQLLLAVTRADKLATCVECGMPFARRRSGSAVRSAGERLASKQQWRGCALIRKLRVTCLLPRSPSPVSAKKLRVP